MAYMHDRFSFEANGEIRELGDAEIDAVNGAWLANAAGAALGAYGGAVAGWASSGGRWQGAVIGAAGGAVVGALSPINGLNAAGRAITLNFARAGVVGLTAGGLRLAHH